MELEEFQESCNNKKCLKRVRYDAKTCWKTSKQTNCFKSYTRLESKKVEKRQQNKQDWNEQADFDNEVWLRDTGEVKGNSSTRENWQRYCRLWQVLTPDEKIYLENYDDELFLNSKLEIAHIKPKSTHGSERKALENVVLVSHSFHRRLTDMLHPVTKKHISSSEVQQWLESARDKIRYVQ